MSKDKKRTISELLKDRPEGRFVSSGFDLLGEGARIVAKMDDDLFSQDKVPHPVAVDEEEGTVAEPDVDSAIEDPAIAAIASMLHSRGVNFAIENNAIADGSVAEIAIEESAIARSAVVDFTREDFAIANNAMAENAIDRSAIAKTEIADNAIADLAMEDIAMVNPAIADYAMGSHAIVDPAIAGSVGKKARIKKEASVSAGSKKITIKLKSLATREAYQKSHAEIERLKSQETATLVDNYVFDTLFKEINNPSEAMVYLYLWRRTKGSGAKQVELSYQVLSDAIGISKRAGQDVLKRLGEKKLIKINRESKTGIPSYEVLQPWNKK